MQERWRPVLVPESRVEDVERLLRDFEDDFEPNSTSESELDFE